MVGWGGGAMRTECSLYVLVDLVFVQIPGGQMASRRQLPQQLRGAVGAAADLPTAMCRRVPLIQITIRKSRRLFTSLLDNLLRGDLTQELKVQMFSV